MSNRNWKDRFREAMFECVDLQKRKIHRDLLSYLVLKANAQSKSCWVSRREMARVQGCSLRNVKDIVRDLRDIGALLQLRFSELPAKNQQDINAISPRPMKGSSNVYYLCTGWADDVLATERVNSKVAGSIGISVADRKRGSAIGNSKRRRYGPLSDVSEVDHTTTPEHDDWLILNAVGGKWVVPTTPAKYGKGVVPTTDILIEDNQAASAVPTDGPASAFDLHHSQANPLQSIFPLQGLHGTINQHGYGGGAAVAPDPSPAGLARPEDTSEQEAAGARANDRRAS